MVRALAALALAVFAPRMATLIMFSTAALCRKAHALPGWAIAVSYLGGAVEFVNVTIAEPTLYVFPAWIALISVVMLLRRHPILQSSGGASLDEERA